LSGLNAADDDNSLSLEALKQMRVQMLRELNRDESQEEGEITSDGDEIILPSKSKKFASSASAANPAKATDIAGEEGEITSDEEDIIMPSRVKKGASTGSKAHNKSASSKLPLKKSDNRLSREDSASSKAPEKSARMIVAGTTVRSSGTIGGDAEEANNSGGSDKENKKAKKKKVHNTEAPSRYYRQCFGS
jgi:hypothetical protein